MGFNSGLKGLKRDNCREPLLLVGL